MAYDLWHHGIRKPPVFVRLHVNKKQTYSKVSTLESMLIRCILGNCCHRILLSSIGQTGENKTKHTKSNNNKKSSFLNNNGFMWTGPKYCLKQGRLFSLICIYFLAILFVVFFISMESGLTVLLSFQPNCIRYWPSVSSWWLGSGDLPSSFFAFLCFDPGFW